MDGWKDITFDDIPSVEEFKALTLALLKQGITNSDLIRNAIRQERKLKVSKPIGGWNDSPSGKFINQHAWGLEQLVVEGKVAKIAEKEYRMMSF